MYANIKKSLSFHKEGFNGLKLVHKADTSIIPVAIIQAVVKATYPYIQLFLGAYIIDSLLSGEYRSATIYGAIMISSQFIVGSILDIVSNVLEFKQIKVQKLIKMKIRKKALEIDYETLEDAKTLENLNSADKAMNYRGGFGQLVSNYCLMLEGVISIATSIGLVIYLCFQIPKINSGVLSVLAGIPASLIMLITFIALTLIINFRVVKYLNDNSLEFFKKQIGIERGLDYYIQQIMMAYERGKVIRLYNMNDMLNKKVSSYIDHSAKELRWYFKIQYISLKGKSLASSILIMFSYAFALLKVLVEAISIGELTKYVGAITQLNLATSQIIEANDQIRMQCEVLKIFNDFMTLENKRESGSIPIEKRNDNEYEIEFHNVTFAYPGSDTPTLKNVSCKINIKDKMAIVGKNGAGKTTFIKLITRLYDPTEGKITLNGIDIRKYDYKEYLNLFGVVFQDFSLFAFPIEQNVATSVEQDTEKVWDMLNRAGIKERVENMPLNIKTPLYKYDDEGIECSGGELQKIAIARALYKDAPFVILDEPTAALDPISEYEIYSRFDKLVKDKTSIYISHRMSSCRFCDDIIVFDNGQIIQRGSHDELIELDESLYAEMWEAQSSYYAS